MLFGWMIMLLQNLYVLFSIDGVSDVSAALIKDTNAPPIPSEMQAFELLDGPSGF